ncbi:hypothetical protein CP985_14395 [Malaciobacter mytili LMG 24559]|uniref:DNA (cytosine-5-)-methyltransferase n=1 Tax=Malaciobacter mytili LMG 24559 TaxID=1032238 RepID=A0AAX2ACE4_9BACT|nr:DNA cytosine methyltransferase [Malaciobacter mytili]AXH16320.1 type II cytosine-specific DNA methyltransferase [Malaciobacter mytili LMG 24559]RXK12394.1 hypothetical protein CP985_14395 [Malaciobacter mytili LMG 24559]
MSANNLIKTYSSKIGDKDGTKRVWIESQKIHETLMAEHLKYEPEYDFENKKIILRPGFTHSIIVRQKNNMPVIDIVNRNINKIFDGYNHIVIKLYNDEIIIEPLKEETEQKRAKEKSNNKTPTMIEIFAGGGTLVKSLKDAGIKPIAAIELEDKYLQNTELNNPNIITYCGDLAKLDISLLPDADIISAGIPCEGYSQAQTKAEKFEAHPTGSLGFYVLKIIDAIRPAVVLIEEVPNFKNSAIATMARYVLTSMGYNISETELIGSDYGSLTKRKRYCMVASIKKGFKFLDSYKIECNKTVKDILEIPIDDREWHSIHNSRLASFYLKKEAEHIAKGNGFRIARTSINDNITATITKGHYLQRITEPILVHPEDSNCFSIFTPREIARINSLPDDFKLPEAKTTSGEIIGQGVCYNAFNAVGKMIVQHFNSIEYDEEKEKLLAFKEKINTTNVDYTNDQISCFFNGTLF